MRVRVRAADLPALAEDELADARRFVRFIGRGEFLALFFQQDSQKVMGLERRAVFCRVFLRDVMAQHLRRAREIAAGPEGQSV